MRSRDVVSANTSSPGRVDHDGGRVLVDELLHLLEVRLPVLVGQQVVLPGLDLLRVLLITARSK